MKKIDKILASIIISSLFIFSSYELFFWGGRLFGLHTSAMALTGLTFGVLFCLVWMGDILNNLYTLSWWYYIIFYLVTSFVLFISMKPLIISFLIFALFAGLYAGRRVVYENGSKSDLINILKKAALFSEIVFVIYYLISVIIVLTSAESIISINFLHSLTVEIAISVLWVVVILIGILLLPLNYFLVIWVGKSLYSIKTENDRKS